MFRFQDREDSRGHWTGEDEGDSIGSDEDLGCLITPHMAWASLAARRRIVRTTAENIEAFLRGAPIKVVNSA